MNLHYQSMKDEIKSAINNMVAGVAHWMAYRDEISIIKPIEADAIFTAADILQSKLSSDYTIKREITKKSLSIVGKHRIDLAIISKNTNNCECLIEFKLADATNEGYEGDVKKLKEIKQENNSIDCLVVILYRNACPFDKPKELVDDCGYAKKSVVKIGKNQYRVRVRRVCNSFTSSRPPKSKKAICLEVL